MIESEEKEVKVEESKPKFRVLVEFSEDEEEEEEVKEEPKEGNKWQDEEDKWADEEEEEEVEQDNWEIEEEKAEIKQRGTILQDLQEENEMFKKGQQFTGNKTQLVAPQKIEYTRKKLKSISICIPDSIIDKCQSSELRSYFISQLARTCSQFQVDEIIILKDHSYKTKSLKFDATGYVARNLQYIETPQYLRKALFGIHPDLKYTGLMNPIECKHHLKADEWCQYREGVVLNRPARKGDESSWVDIGLYMKQCKVSISLQAGTRVTVKLDQEGFEITEKFFTGTVVSSSQPKDEANLYWGY